MSRLRRPDARERTSSRSHSVHLASRSCSNDAGEGRGATAADAHARSGVRSLLGGRRFRTYVLRSMQHVARRAELPKRGRPSAWRATMMVIALFASRAAADDEPAATPRAAP